jgi:amino acid adenylation domain-containing protein
MTYRIPSENFNSSTDKNIDDEKLVVRESLNMSCLTNVIEFEKARYFHKVTRNSEVEQLVVLSSIFAYFLDKYFRDFEGVIKFEGNIELYPSTKAAYFNIPRKGKAIDFKEFIKLCGRQIQDSLFNSVAEPVNFQLDEKFSYGISVGKQHTDDMVSGLFLEAGINHDQSLRLNFFHKEGNGLDDLISDLVKNYVRFIIELDVFVHEKDFPIISESENQRLLVDFNNTRIEYPSDRTIIDMFGRQAEITPDNTALVFRGESLGYRELDYRVNRFANFLSSRYSITESQVIGVLLPKSIDSIVALLAILKLGAVYLPIDPEYPADRIDYIIKDSAVSLIVGLELNRGIGNFEITYVSIDRQDTSEYSITSPKNTITSKSLAYIIYTSGSTGFPKGVLIEHAGNVNMSLSQIAKFGISAADNVVWFASPSFDASISEIMMALYSGATLCIPTKDDISNRNLFVKFLKDSGATVATFPPSYLDTLSNTDIHGLRCIITAGEAANVKKAKEVLDCGIAYFNAYGPTEYSVCATIFELQKGDNVGQSLPIGLPISNTQIYILDENRDVLPVGVIGKIYVSGAGTARGYLNKPELTSEKFLPNPFLNGARMYDTGDLGRWRRDGNVEFVGREDHQVKIRGFRIELGEIEAVLRSFSDDVRQVVAETKEVGGERCIVAYYVSDSVIGKSEIRKYLHDKLPAYMVPNFFVQLEYLPITPNGKIDRKKLPAIVEGDFVRANYVAPRTDTETELVGVWEDILRVNQIGITDNFFDLGGHSLNVAQVINRVHRQLGKTIGFKEFFSNPTVAQLSGRLSGHRFSSIPKAASKESYALTASQRRLWILSQLEEGSVAYNMPAVVKLVGEVDKGRLEESLIRIIDRFEILRTSFKIDDTGEIRQYIHPSEQINFRIEERDFFRSDGNVSAIDEYLHSINAIPFDLSVAPLLRCSLVRIDEAQFVLFLSMHHIIGDGWSSELFVSEVLSVYNSQSRGEPIVLPELGIQYKDYAEWSQKLILSESYQESKAFWQAEFSGDLPVLNLPSFKNRPVSKTYNGAGFERTFPTSFLDKLRQFSQRENVTLFMTLTAGINALLFRYTGQADLIIGTPVAGREHSDLENQLGLFLNTLAIRTRVDGNSSFADLVQTEKDVLLAAYQHQSYPLDALVEALDLKRDVSRSALFDVLVVLQNQVQVKSIVRESELDGIKIEGYKFNRHTAQFDVSFIFTEDRENLVLNIEYNCDVLDAFFIERIFGHFENLLNYAIDNSGDSILSLSYLEKKEEVQILEQFNDTVVDYPMDQTVVDLFEAQVQRTPDRIATVFGDSQLTYFELNERANLLAHYLRSTYSIKADDLVGVKLHKSDQLMPVILGVLKSGAAYVPIDPGYPQSRIDVIERDTNCKIIIDQKVVTLFADLRSKFSAENISRANEPNDLACVIYTSGTTGVPKGVMVEHRNIVRLVKPGTFFPLNEQSILLSTGSVSFDATIMEFFGTLLNGSRLVLAAQDDLLELEKLGDIVKKNAVSCLWMTSAWFSQVVDGQPEIFEGIEHLIVGGDVVSPNHVAKIISVHQSLKITNGYGPTENTTFSTTFRIDAQNYARLPIGRPIENSFAYILDEQRNLVPVGVSGKLYVSGAGVARGYLNNVSLTSQKFLDNPFVFGTKMYDTGDTGRWLPNGNIEFLGRTDNQVKIRGFRIELGEIENATLAYASDIIQVVAEARKTGEQNVIVLYYVSHKEISRLALREFLGQRLPEYMVPAFYVNLPEFPLTAHGKIDRQALPEVTDNDILRRDYRSPGNKTERVLCEIWQEVLGVEQVGISDNFFELGGHSLVVLQVVNRMQKQLGMSVSFKEFFTYPTIESLSKALGDGEYEPIPKTSTSASYALTASQTRLWILSQFEEGNVAYSMPAAVRIRGGIDINLLRKSFQEVIERHEILRTVFRIDDNGDVRQYIIDKGDIDFQISFKDFSSERNSEEKISQYLDDESSRAFDLAQGPLIRASLLECGEGSSVFFLSLHHIIGDGWSMKLLISEISTCYNALIEGENYCLPELRIQYRDYTEWLAGLSNHGKYKKSRDYWLKQFSGNIPILDLPRFNDRPANKSYHGSEVTRRFPKEFLDRMKEFSARNDATLFMTLMAGINSLLSRYTGQKDIVVGTTIAGREHADLEGQMGLFLNTLAIRTNISGCYGFGNLLKLQKKILLEAYEHQDFPFDELVRQLNLRTDSSRSALIDVMVVLQSQNQLKIFDGDGMFKGCAASEYNLKREIAKCDLTFTFSESEELELCIEYNSDIYGIELIERMFVHFPNLLTLLLDNPAINIFELDYVSEVEKNNAKKVFLNTTSAEQVSDDIINLFKKQVSRTPDGIAVVYEDVEVSYGELDQRSDQFANYLSSTYSVGDGGLVGVRLERSDWLIVAVLGILKTGAGFVGIDSSYADWQTEHVIANSCCGTVISEIEMESFFSIKDRLPVKFGERSRREDCATLVYSFDGISVPSGVSVGNILVANTATYFRENFGLGSDYGGLNLASVADERFLWEIFPILISGGTIFVVHESYGSNNVLLAEYIYENDISYCVLRSSVLRSLPSRKLHSLKTILLFETQTVQKDLDTLPAASVCHWLYSPVGFGVPISVKDFDMNAAVESESLGRPISDVRMCVLDEFYHLTPIGVPGEIYINRSRFGSTRLSAMFDENSGRNVSFVKDQSLFATNDMGRYLPDGSIQYIKRKLNDLDVDDYLRKLENVLRHFEGVNEVFACLKETGSNYEPVVYMITSAGMDDDLFRSHLEQHMPGFLLPSVFVYVDEIPLLADGHVDMSKLPETGKETPGKGLEYLAPTSEIQSQLTILWTSVLEREQIGIKDNFFELGGNSLKAMQLFKAISKSFPGRIQISHIFSHPTILAFSELLFNEETTEIKSVISNLDF